MLAGLVVAGLVFISAGEAQNTLPKTSMPESARARDTAKKPSLPPGFDPSYVHEAPVGGRIAVVGRYIPPTGKDQHGLFFVEKDGRVRQILDKALKFPGDWSPDSRKFVISNGAGYWLNNPLVIVDAETGAVEDTGIQGLNPDWSPDGRVITVATNFEKEGGWYGGPPGGQIGLWDVAAKTLTPITPAGYSVSDPRTGWHVEGGARKPVWSPDGNRLIFQRWGYNTREKKQDWETWVVNRAGTELRKVFDTSPYPEPTWSDDSRSVIAAAGKDHPAQQAEIASLPVVDRAHWPGPPPALVATSEKTLESRRQAEAVDLDAVFQRNRAWLNPSFEHLRSIQFVHRMEPSRLDERFAWRSDGASMLEVVHREDKHAAEEVGRLWVTSSQGIQYVLTLGNHYPRSEERSAAILSAETRDHLMGTRATFMALQWGRNPENFERLALRQEAEGGTMTLELVTSRKARRLPSLNAGAMFETTSWAYLHDLKVARSELTIDAKNHRILREVDYNVEGELVCDAHFEDWLDVEGDRTIPRLVRLEFPTYKFHVTYRFQWHKEGIWLLESGESRFDDHEPQRETIADLSIDAPLPELDRALERVTGVHALLNAKPNGDVEQRALSLFPFELGRRRLISVPDPQGRAAWNALVALTLSDEKRSRFQTLSKLIIEIESRDWPKDHALLLTLWDEQARPVRSSRIPPPKERQSRIELGADRELGRARYWTLTDLSPAMADAPADPTALAPVKVVTSAFPYRFHEEMIVQVPADALDASSLRNSIDPDGNPPPTKLRSIRFETNERGELIARAEIVSQAQMVLLEAALTAVLLDAKNRPIAGESLREELRVETAVYDSSGHVFNFGRLDGAIPKRVLLGLQTQVIGWYMGSSWLRSGGIRGPLFSIDQLLAAEAPVIRTCGLAALYDKIHPNLARSRKIISKDGDFARLSSAERGRINRALEPHIDRLAKLIAREDDPDSLSLPNVAVKPLPLGMGI